MKRIDTQYLEARGNNTIKAGYPLPKWIQFCTTLLEQGYIVNLYEAKTTVSKYIYVKSGNKEYKVRFSNHKPNKFMEIKKEDCDFYVGITNTGVRTTSDALVAVKEFFYGIKSI